MLEQGDRIKITVRFRGREIMHVHLGMELLTRLREGLEGYAKIDQEPKLDGKQITMLLVPLPKNKSVTNDPA